MSIANRQLTNVVDKIIKEELQKGRVPSLDDVISRVNKFFAGSKLGRPFTKYRPAKSREESNPDDWNQTIEEIYQDLLLLHQENTDQVSRIISGFDYYEVEKRKLDRQIDELQNTIDELLLLNNNADGYLYSIYEDFTTLRNIDLSNTTAWIDLRERCATVQLSKVGNLELDLSDAQIYGEPLSPANPVSSTDIEPIYNVLDDSINTFWIHKLVTNSTGPITYRVHLKLDGSPTTKLKIEPHVTGPTTFTVYWSEDNGINFRIMGSSAEQRTISFNYNEARFTDLRIDIIKETHDELTDLGNGSVGYVYYFGILNISLLKVGYEYSGIVQSVPRPVLDRQGNRVPADQISLDVVDDVPPGCSINYYVAIADENPEWQPITPFKQADSEFPKVIDLKNLSSFHPVLGLSASTLTPQDMYPANEQYINGLAFYKLSSDMAISSDRKILYSQESPFLYKGIDQWKIEFFQDAKSEYHEPSYNDWADAPKSTNVVYRAARQPLTFYQQESQMNYRISSWVYMEKQTASSIEIRARSLTNKSATVLTKTNVRIYVNNKQVANCSLGTATPVSLPFAAGWNSIVILVYKHDDKEFDLPLDLNFSLKVRAVRDALTYVPLFEYTRNIPERDTSSYSIDETNHIIINEAQRQQGANYEFRYKYYIDYLDDDLIFRAELVRGESAHLTPKLKYYRIRVS